MLGIGTESTTCPPSRTIVLVTRALWFAPVRDNFRIRATARFRTRSMRAARTSSAGMSRAGLAIANSRAVCASALISRRALAPCLAASAELSVRKIVTRAFSRDRSRPGSTPFGNAVVVALCAPLTKLGRAKATPAEIARMLSAATSMVLRVASRRNPSLLLARGEIMRSIRHLYPIAD
jgi:hypothetical protein